MKVLVITSRMPFWAGGWGRYSNDLTNALSRLGVHVLGLDRLGLPGPLSWKKNYFLAFWYTLKLVANKEVRGADIIHCHVETYAPITMILSFVLRKPYCLTLHGSYAVKPFSMGPLISFIQEASYRKAKILIAVSNFTKERVLEFIPGLNIDVIPNGIEIQEPILDSVRRNILTVAPLKERKGLHYLTEALPEVFEKTDANWIIVGNDDDRVYVGKIFSRLEEYKDRCFHYKNISDEELHKLYRSSRLFIMTPATSRFDFEGFGLVYLEANSYGVPAIGSRNSGAEEAILDGKSGFLVDQGDSEQISNYAKEIFSDDKLFNNMSQTARDWAENHEIKMIATMYVQKYKNCFG